MNVAHPDEMEQDKTDNDGTQDADAPGRTAKPVRDAAPDSEFMASDPIIINKRQ